ncbi:DUF5063 domain-containing protein [Ilyomonas limi]|uniref:DUF5063 domain-containing protein n=1 Tax=Ilyomonas limi TaxID=2575867 RepID=A0A4U3KQW0_9BACT|nr:DUF5063 domain-containing protein [Ilyomonas limi]TKK64009.1 DUF5063 domain-containing protein [Ilyomonas limi]
MSVDNIAKTKDFITFVDRARNFCTFLETHQNDNYKSFISDIQKQLIELYTFARTLPDFDLPDRDIAEIDISDDDIRDLLSFTRKRLRGPFYWIVFDPTDHSDTASVCGDLVDDLGDMYKDIKTFLTGFDDADDDVKQNALWHLKWSFDNHWNDHCMNAIYAIHYFLKHAD